MSHAYLKPNLCVRHIEVYVYVYKYSSTLPSIFTGLKRHTELFVGKKINLSLSFFWLLGLNESKDEICKCEISSNKCIIYYNELSYTPL